MSFKQIFISSVGRKLVMGFTGFFLISFLMVHAGLNACIWWAVIKPYDHGEMFNKAAHFMGNNVIPRILEIGLFVGFIIHIVQGYMLSAMNITKRGHGYDRSYSKGSKWYSRSMGILGSLILIFLVVHLYDFWIPSRFGDMGLVTPLPHISYNQHNYHNLYLQMSIVFQNVWIVLLYIIGCVALAYHLAHGFLSAFKTIGVYNKRYLCLLQTLGCVFAIIVPLIFILMPLSFYFHWLS